MEDARKDTEQAGRQMMRHDSARVVRIETTNRPIGLHWLNTTGKREDIRDPDAGEGRRVEASERSTQQAAQQEMNTEQLGRIDDAVVRSPIALCIHTAAHSKPARKM